MWEIAYAMVCTNVAHQAALEQSGAAKRAVDTQQRMYEGSGAVLKAMHQHGMLNYKPRQKDCVGCGAPLSTMAKCEYCGRMA